MASPPPGAAPPTRVLVVDDDVLMCRFLQRRLERHGFVVAVEDSAEDALERLAAEEFDLVLSDLNLTGVDGLALTRQLAASGFDLPVILISGSVTREVAASAVLGGAWDCLAKPVNPGVLVASMERAHQHHLLEKELRQRRRPTT